MKDSALKLVLGALALGAALAAPASAMGSAETPSRVHHVVLVSVDGFHALDLANYVKAHPQSTLAILSQTGTTFTQAKVPFPSDSFPGMVALVTGGTPASTGIWYDHTINRNFLAPGSTKDNPGQPSAEVPYDETISVGYNDGKWGDAGVKPLEFTGAPSIDPSKLPVDPKTFLPVYPHNYLLVNTVFEVAKAAGLKTAWADKHPAYDILNGPSGQGITDLFTPEINSLVPGKDSDFTKDASDTVTYDNLKVQALVNEIRGFDHTGKIQVGVPAILGMNFQAVSVGQKVVKGGYADAQGTPAGQLITGLDGVDQGLGQIVAALKEQKLFGDTLVIITSKHGQAPVDQAQVKWVDDGSLEPFLAAHGITAWTASNDTTGFLWLKDPTQAAAAASLLQGTPVVYPVFDKATKKNLFEKDQTAATWGKIDKILYGEALPYKDPSATGRYPDLILQLAPGSVYGKPWKKIAEHGGASDDETHVALLVEGPGVRSMAVGTPVLTTQVAPTILKALGLDPQALLAVQKEKTQALPGLY